MSVAFRVRRSMPAPMPAGGGGGDDATQVDLGRIGHEDPSPAWMRLEGGQAFVEVTLRSGDEIVARVGDSVHDLAIGDIVSVVLVDGDPGQAVVTSVLHDLEAALPSSVAGVSTGASAATEPGVSVPAPTFSFLRTRDGRLLAIETGSGGDIVVHSGASVHIQAAATHIEGAVHLAAGPSTPPTGSLVAPGNAQAPGVPMVERLPVPLVNATLPPYGGDRYAVVRAVDAYQSNIAVDVTFWSKWVGMLAMFEAWAVVLPVLLPALNILKAIPPVPWPVSMESKAMTASTQVTADG